MTFVEKPPKPPTGVLDTNTALLRQEQNDTCSESCLLFPKATVYPAVGWESGPDARREGGGGTLTGIGLADLGSLATVLVPPAPCDAAERNSEVPRRPGPDWPAPQVELRLRHVERCRWHRCFSKLARSPPGTFLPTATMACFQPTEWPLRDVPRRVGSSGDELVPQKAVSLAPNPNPMWQLELIPRFPDIVPGPPVRPAPQSQPLAMDGRSGLPAMRYACCTEVPPNWRPERRNGPSLQPA